MPNFLENMKLATLSTAEKEEFVSLIELLLTDQAEVYNKQMSIASNDGVSGNKVRTRKDRRRSGRSASTRKRTEAKRGGATQRMEQLRASKVAQDRRRKQLLAYQTQAGNKGPGQSSRTMKFKKRSATAAAAKAAQDRAQSVEINPTLRPAILALIDFQPAFDSSGKSTNLGKLLKVNRAVRALGIESTTAPDTSTEFISELEYTTAYAQLMVSYNEFLSTLDVSNIKMLDDATSAFSLDKDSLGETSNTEVLWTLIQEYSRAFALSSPRLEERSERELLIGPKLIPFAPSKTSSLRWALAPQNKTPFDSRSGNASMSSNEIFRNLIDGDEEINLKVGLNALSKEMIMSFNKMTNQLTSEEDLNIKDIFQSRVTRPSNNTTIQPAVRGTTASAPFGDRNLGGITYLKGNSRSRQYYYPFERGDLLPDSRHKRAQHSAPDEIKKLFLDGEPSVEDGPYTAINEHYADVNEKILKLIDSAAFEQKITTDDGEEIDKAFSVIVFEKILNEVILQILIDNASSSTARAARLWANWLYLTCTSSSTWGWLLIYLGFLREKLAGDTNNKTDMSTDFAFGVSISEFILNSSHLESLLGNPKTTRKITKKFTIPTSTTTVTPGMEEAKTTATNDVVRTVSTSRDRNEATDAAEETSLEATFDISFEEMCDKCATHLTNKINSLSSGASPTLVLPSSLNATVTCTKDNIADMLKSIPTEESSIAHELLRLISSVDVLMQSQGSSAFTADNFTAYSGIPKMNMAILSIGCACLMSSLLFGDKIRVSGEIDNSSSSSTSSSSSSSSSSGKWSKAKLKVSTPAIQTTPYAYLYLKKATEIKSTIEEYLANDTESAASVFGAYSEPLARVVSAIQDESEFLSSFPASLEEYFQNSASGYEGIIDSLNYDVDSSDVDETLVNRIRSGLPMSNDMIKMLMSFTRTYDSSGETYESIRTNDKLLSTENLSLLASILRENDFCIPDKLKYIVVGLPSGMLGSVQSQPVNIEDSTRSMIESSKKSFTVILDKIDLTRPEQEFKSKEYSFSRELFYNRTEEISSEPNVYFNRIPDTFVVSEEDETAIGNDISEDQIWNVKVDTALKLYSDLLLDLDFNEASYINGTTQQAMILTSSILMPKLGGVDKTTSAFLSGSNVVFDVEQRELNGFLFFQDGSNSLDMSMFQGLDPTGYSIYSYLNRYGGFASASSKKSMLKYGTKFERILCIPFDPVDFEIEPAAVGDNAGTENIVNTNMNLAESEVGLGHETSQGVELSTYRVSIILPEGDVT